MQFARFRYVVIMLTLLALLVLVRGSGPTSGRAITTADESRVKTTPTDATSAEGHWEGAIDVTGQSIPVRVTLESAGDVLKGTVDFPTQNVLSLPLDKARQQGSRLHFEAIPAPNTAEFDGSLQGETISGVFQQVGITGTFELQRVQIAAGAPLPYKAEDVEFQNGSIILAGTLTLPDGEGPSPAVILISGSGSQNRDSEVYGFKVFGVLADYLTRQGIAVLRYDDRGIGGSSQGSIQDTSETYAEDVIAAVQFLKSRAEIDSNQIGLLGDSEGGIIAPMVATRTDDVAFIILMSGPGLPGKDVVLEQMRMIAEANGVSETQIEQNAALAERIIDAVITGQGWDAVKANLRQQALDTAAAMPESQRQPLGDINQWADKEVETQVQVWTIPWITFFLTYDPAVALQGVTVPVLALFGGLDVQVPAASNEAAIMAALDKGGNKDHTAKVFPDANHLYQSAKTGSPNEYAQLKPEFTAGFLETIGAWILAHVRLAGG